MARLTALAQEEPDDGFNPYGELQSALKRALALREPDPHKAASDTFDSLSPELTSWLALRGWEGYARMHWGKRRNSHTVSPLERSYYIPANGVEARWAYLADLTEPEVRRIEQEYVVGAREMSDYAKRMNTLAKVMRGRSATVVKDIPADVLNRILDGPISKLGTIK